MEIKRIYESVTAIAKAVKAAKFLGLSVKSMTGLGTWRTLHPHPESGKHFDIEGPFQVRQGIGPAFIDPDGIEIFMFEARVEIIFEDLPK
ncbi:hypothetical protein [Myxococcus phage Mx1]|nr:hypothetical protein [Myxococcus phage Mx1]